MNRKLTFRRIGTKAGASDTEHTTGAGTGNVFKREQGKLGTPLWSTDMGETDMVEDSRKVLLEALVEYWQDMIEANKLRVAATENDRMLMELKRAERDCRKFCAQ